MNKSINGILTNVEENDLDLLKSNPKEFWNGVSIIGSNAFTKCTYLTEIDIPSSIDIISDGAFMGCQCLKSVKLHPGLKNIGKMAFGETPLLEEITIPCTVSNVANYAFFNNAGLRKVVLENGVMRIGRGAFSGCCFLEDIQTSKTLRFIEDEAFLGCINLKNVKLNEGLCVIGEYAFASTKELKKLDLPSSIESIEEGAFKGSGLEKIDLPFNVDILNRDVFTDCKSLSRVNLGHGIRKIIDYAFRGCDNLERISIPGTVGSLDRCSFSECTNLKEVILEKGIIDIGNAFAKSKSLSKIELPSTMVAISEGAFKDCPKLEKVVLQNGIKRIEKDSFKGCDNLKNIEFPSGVSYVDSGLFGELQMCLNVGVLDSSHILVSKDVIERDDCVSKFSGFIDDKNIIDTLNGFMTKEEIKRNLFKEDLYDKLDDDGKGVYDFVMSKSIELIFPKKLSNEEFAVIAYTLKDDLNSIKDKDAKEYTQEEIKKIALYNKLISTTLGEYLGRTHRENNIKHLNWVVNNIGNDNKNRK